MGYSPRVYTSLTLIATQFPRILTSRAWHDFLGIRARFDIKGGLVLTGDLKHVIVTLQYTYITYTVILSPLGNQVLFLWKFITWFFWYFWFQSLSKWSEIFSLISIFHINYIFLILSLGIGYPMLKLVAEIRARSGSVVDPWCSEKRRKSVISSFNLIFIMLCFIEILRTKFL